MGRQADEQRIEAILQLIGENDGHLRAADIAQKLGLPKSSVTRLLPVIDSGEEKRLVEDERGFLGLFKNWR